MQQVNSVKVFTIGHSTHSLDDFIGMLKTHDVTAVVDVRSHPYSRWVEHFGREVLRSALSADGIAYYFMGKELGARREERECYEGERASYDRIAELPLFQEGLRRLGEMAKKCRLAVMCAEKEPLDCHRTILICRSLKHFGIEIEHILADGRVEPHADTEARLVRQMGVFRTLFEPDLTDQDLTDRAYEMRAAQIAYQSDREGAML